MRTALALAVMLISILLGGCATQAGPQEAMQSSTTGTTWVRTGYVTDIRDVTTHDHAGNPAAPALGALVGGVAGSLIGSGSGHALGAIGGAAAGSIAARELAKPGTTYRKKVTIRFEDGHSETFDAGADDALRVGERVNVVSHNGTIRITR